MDEAVFKITVNSGEDWQQLAAQDEALARYEILDTLEDGRTIVQVTTSDASRLVQLVDTNSGVVSFERVGFGSV